MHCLKCGNEIPEDQVFCEDCLKIMENYPVQQDAPLQLPVRKTEEALRHPPKKQRRIPKPEEVIQHQRNTIHSLITTLVLVILILGMCIAAFVIDYITEDTVPIAGQNYTSTTQATKMTGD